MNILLTAAGASYSTKDVEVGYRKALEDAGANVIFYALDGRIEQAHEYLHHAYQKAIESGQDVEEPSEADTVYWASSWALVKALRCQPDWVFVVSGMYMHPDVLIMMQRAGLNVALLLTESPYSDVEQSKIVRYADAVFTNERTSVESLRFTNPNTHYLPHAYDPDKHTSLPDLVDDEVDAHDVVFVGTGFTERQELLEQIDWAGIALPGAQRVDFGLYGYFPHIEDDSPLAEYYHDYVVDNEATAALYRKAKIGLNLYRTSLTFGEDAPRIGYAESMNPRALELAATACFTISDYREEQDEVLGDAVPTFETPQECEELIHYYLAHDDQRNERASQLPAKVQGRTYDAGAEFILDVLAGTEREQAKVAT